MTTPRHAPAAQRETAPHRRAAMIGLAVAVAVLVAALAVPPLTAWWVHVNSFPPLHAEWMPRLGPGTPAAVLLAVAAVVWGPRATTWSWPRLLVAVYLFGAAWMISLATVDGVAGLGHILETDYEYLQTARAVTDFGATLQEYVSRIPFAHPDNWPVHIAGHPPGALLFFLVLVRLGLGGATAAGLVVIALGASTAVAVLLTVRRLSSEDFARRAALLLTIGPAAIWVAVSADGMFAAVAAWAAWALSVAATSRGALRVGVWSVVSGLLFGYCVMLSYGLPLLGVLAVTILLLARSWHPLPWAVVSACAVVGAFALGGFAWWEALPVLHERYWDGIASDRPAGYWMWGNLAALVFSAGPWVGPAVGAAFAELFGAGARATRRAGAPEARQALAVAALALAGFAMVALADLSQMSKAEVERIWLPFVPWMLVGAALLPPGWRRWGIGVQAGFALTVQHLLFTGW
ncbi:hypothetical protein K0817_013770 [Microbacterium sp. HD4P20]|uniref:hypothetical protein n=1 Tax=Microbacterium sp. HD4P20 TaxID=2864874 RepID=UPI0020A5C9BF|nr:hypothetical protein [Microbacterium sp. HD4P20]MCP2637622.1 hypothetical protein [Microbacterium sp. HD4P20]